MKSDNIVIETKSETYPIVGHDDSNRLYIGEADRHISVDLSNAVLEGLDYESFFKEMMKRVSRIPLMKHSCNSCGGTLEINADKHIFVCPYCGSVYAIGTVNLNG